MHVYRRKTLTTSSFRHIYYDGY